MLLTLLENNPNLVIWSSFGRHHFLLRRQAPYEGETGLKWCLDCLLISWCAQPWVSRDVIGKILQSWRPAPTSSMWPDVYWTGKWLILVQPSTWYIAKCDTFDLVTFSYTMTRYYVSGHIIGLVGYDAGSTEAHPLFSFYPIFYVALCAAKQLYLNFHCIGLPSERLSGIYFAIPSDTASWRLFFFDNA